MTNLTNFLNEENKNFKNNYVFYDEKRNIVFNCISDDAITYESILICNRNGFEDREIVSYILKMLFDDKSIKVLNSNKDYFVLSQSNLALEKEVFDEDITNTCDTIEELIKNFTLIFSQLHGNHSFVFDDKEVYPSKNRKNYEFYKNCVQNLNEFLELKNTIYKYILEECTIVNLAKKTTYEIVDKEHPLIHVEKITTSFKF